LSKIRQNFGHNNNSNVLEFRTAMRQLLLKNLVIPSYAANCIALDNTSFDIHWKKNRENNFNEDEEMPDFLSK